MLYTKEAAMANIRNRDGGRVFYLGQGDQLTSEARDYLTAQRITILPAREAKPERYRLLTGGFAEEKPEHMTHLNGDFLVPKTHPRIAFRGAMDTLEAELLLCMCYCPHRQKELEDVLTLARKVLRWDVLNEPVEETPLLGLTPQQLRERSHRPQDFYGQPHFMPTFTDGQALLWLNKARCAARQAELAAVAAFRDGEGNPTRPDILVILNRLSSALYILMIQEKQDVNGWISKN